MPSVYQLKNAAQSVANQSNNQQVQELAQIIYHLCREVDELKSKLDRVEQTADCALAEVRSIRR